MNKLFLISILIVSIYTIYANSNSSNNKINRTEINPIYDINLKKINGEDIHFSNYKGKKILIVNTATECGFTNQLESLQKLQEKFKEKLVIIGTPSNDFMNQEPRKNNEISNYCKINYGVDFTLSEKIHVKGKMIHPVYKYLTDKISNGQNNKHVSWNFNKFLIDENGYLIKRFGSMTKPLSNKIISLIES